MGKGLVQRATAAQPRGDAADRADPASIEQGGSAALFLKRPSAVLDVTGRKVGPRRSLSRKATT